MRLPPIPPRFALLAAPVLALTATGCGTDEAEALTKPEFIDRANAICTEANTEVDAMFEAFWTEFEDVDFDDPAQQQTIFDAFADVAGDLTPVVKDMAADLRELAPPAEDRELIETLLDDLEAAADEIAEVTAAAAAGDEAARAQMDSESEDPFADVNRRAREYGLSACGEDGD